MVIDPPMFVIVKIEFPAPSHEPLKVIFGGIRVGVEVRVLVGVGVTQYDVEEAISTPLESFTRTVRFPYRPLIESSWF